MRYNESKARAFAELVAGLFLGAVTLYFCLLAAGCGGEPPSNPERCEPFDVCAVEGVEECAPECDEDAAREDGYLGGWNDGHFDGFRDGVASVECAPIATCACLGSFEPLADFIGCALVEDGNCVSLCGASTFFGGRGELYNCEAPHAGVPQ